MYGSTQRSVISLSISSEIERIKTNIANAYTEIENKGVITTDTKNSDNLASTISAIQTGGTGGGSGDEELVTSFISSIDDTRGENVTKLPDGTTSIGNYAFYNCTKLAIKTLPENVVSIGASAFYGCANITDITLLSDIDTIAANSFNQCTGITKFIMPNITKVPTLANKNAFGSVNFDYGTGGIYVPDALVGIMKGTTNWSVLTSYIKPLSELEG
jgi:hypothetical protein